MEGMQRIAHAFVERPDTILHELVNAAVAICGADSAGISIERDNARRRTTTGLQPRDSTRGLWMQFCRDIRVRAESAWSGGGLNCFAWDSGFLI